MDKDLKQWKYYAKIKPACKAGDHTFQGGHIYISGLSYNCTGILNFV